VNPLKRAAYLAATLAAAPLVLGPLLNPATGREYGIGVVTKLRLLAQMLANTRRIEVLSHVFEHITIATAILKTPRDREGCVVECGTYAGGSTANLSLVCALVGRDLEVFDSFEGLPQPASRDGVVLTGWGGGYHAGQFSASLDDVRANVKRWGNIDVCRFHPGFFEQSMPAFALPCVLVFIDVDLRTSAETCLKYLWPLLATDGHFYTHDAQDLHLASVFFDDAWWNSTLDRTAPGLAGAGNGLGLLPGAGGYGSELGYTIKGL
jgi:Macrocin-O-methyltransferase (TylF)